MSQAPDDEHYRMIAKLLVGGAVVPFLGAGVNRCGRPERTAWKLGECLPSGSELAEYLAREVDYPYQDRTDLLRVSQYVDVTLGNGPLYESLHGVFAAEYPPTPLHRLLASLPALIRRAGRRTFPLIVTTNLRRRPRTRLSRGGRAVRPRDLYRRRAGPRAVQAHGAVRGLQGNYGREQIYAAEVRRATGDREDPW